MIIALFYVTGLALMPVRTGSMTPTARPGDAVIGISPNIKPPGVGDIVVAEPAMGDADIPPTAHRIIEATDEGWRTQGDNNPNPDGWTVKPDDITHTVIAVAPMRFLRNPLIVGLAAGVVALVWMWPRAHSPTPTGPWLRTPMPPAPRPQRPASAPTRQHTASPRIGSAKARRPAPQSQRPAPHHPSQPAGQFRSLASPLDQFASFATPLPDTVRGDSAAHQPQPSTPSQSPGAAHGP